MIVESVKCDRCGKLHGMESRNYVTIKGNVYIGDDDDAVIGNNLVEDVHGILHDVKCSYFCIPTCICNILNIQPNDFGTIWNNRMDAFGAKRGTVKDLKSI